MRLSRNSRQSRCACLTSERDVYKCKHSILFTHGLLAALRRLLSAAHWLGAFLRSLVKPSVKPNSIEVERHFIFDAWTCASQTNLILLRTTKAEVCSEYQNKADCLASLVVKHDYSPHIDGRAQGGALLKKQKRGNDMSSMQICLCSRSKRRRR